MKIGTIIQWGSNVVPNDWLLCDGSAVSRTTYADLFAIIGTNFGSGDGSTTFNLPDLRGKVAVGKSSETEFDTLGKTGGNKNLQEHSHNFYRQPIYNTEYETGEAVYAQESTTAKLVNAQTQSAGTGDSGNLQPYLVTNYIIKALKNSEIKVSELPIATSFGDSDYTMIVQSGENKKITKSKILESLNDSITIGLSSDLSYTSSTRGKIPFDIEMAKVGTKLTFSDNGIVIGTGVNFIEISATSLQSASNADLCGVLITKNGTTLNHAVAVGFSYITTPYQMHCISISPAIIPVSEGDVLYLVGYISTPTVTVQLQAYNGRANYLTAKVVS